MSISTYDEELVWKNELQMIRNVKLNNHYIFFFSLLVGCLSYFLFDFNYWWSIPIICGIWQIIGEVVRVFAMVTCVVNIIETEVEKKKARGKKN